MGVRLARSARRGLKLAGARGIRGHRRVRLARSARRGLKRRNGRRHEQRGGGSPRAQREARIETYAATSFSGAARVRLARSARRGLKPRIDCARSASTSSPRAQREARIETNPDYAKKAKTPRSPRAQREARIETEYRRATGATEMGSPRAQREARIETRSTIGIACMGYVRLARSARRGLKHWRNQWYPSLGRRSPRAQREARIETIKLWQNSKTA